MKELKFLMIQKALNVRSLNVMFAARSVKEVKLTSQGDGSFKSGLAHSNLIYRVSYDIYISVSFLR